MVSSKIHKQRPKCNKLEEEESYHIRLQEWIKIYRDYYNTWRTQHDHQSKERQTLL